MIPSRSSVVQVFLAKLKNLSALNTSSHHSSLPFLALEVLGLVGKAIFYDVRDPVFLNPPHSSSKTHEDH